MKNASRSGPHGRPDSDRDAQDAVYAFGNGVRVYRSWLRPQQIRRYVAPGNPNLHEPVEEEWVVRLLSAAPEHCTFADVGAGIGYYSFLVKRLKPRARVAAFEPLPSHYEAWLSHLALNGIAPGEIAFFEQAVAAGRGEVNLRDHSYGSNIVREPGPDTMRVNAITMDDLLDITGHVDVMKMDIQGAELDTLRPAAASLAAGRIGALIVGTHSPELHSGVIELLRNCSGEIILDDPHPEHQPDGLVIAKFGN